jgi:hypothetical protein
LNILDNVKNVAILLTFVLVILSAVDISRQNPHSRGKSYERWRILLVLAVLSATLMVIATAMTWR